MSTRLHKYTLDSHQDHRGARQYVTPLGMLPSVTTILKGTTSWGTTPLTSRYAVAARRRGRRFHEEMEAFLERREPSGSEFFPSVRSFLRRMGSVRLVEGPVWHRDGFAGTVDCVAEVDGVLSVIDWKTSRGPKSPHLVDEPHLQVAAYRAAIQALYGVAVPRGFVVIALPEGEAQVLPTANLDDEYEHFLERFASYRASLDLSRSSVGA